MTSFDLAALAADETRRIVVCCGAGGVGKTTLSAALGVAAARAGRRVCVLTIDPARRLGQALGLELDNTPRLVPGVGADGGELWALMLDMKATFDDVVRSYATEDVAEELLNNRFYQTLASSLGGTQEYMAMEKVGQLYAEQRWDLLVVDTPPSRSALDFLDAPARMSRFLDSTLARVLLMPAANGGRTLLRAMRFSMSMVGMVMRKVIGADVLADAMRFASSAQSLFGGFSTRAQRTYRLLTTEAAAFVVIAAPDKDALAEAGYLTDRLRADRLPLAGVVVNRFRMTPAIGATPDVVRSAAADIADELPTAAAALRAYAEARTVAEFDERLVAAESVARPDVPLARVAVRDTPIRTAVQLGALVSSPLG